MAASTTMTIRITPEAKERLGRMAQEARRSPASLAGEAVAAWVAHEAEIEEGVRQGLEDMEQGRTVPHDAAMARIYAAVGVAPGDRG